MKKTAIAFYVALLLFGELFQLSNLAEANPVLYDYYGGADPSKPGAEPPTIEIFPQNNTSFNKEDITFTVNVTIGESGTPSNRWIQLVYYRADWQTSNIQVFGYFRQWGDEPNPTFCSTILNLTGTNNTSLSEGKHTLTVSAIEEGEYEDPPRFEDGLCRIVYYSFHITGSSTVTFIIDRTPPRISILSVENKTYTAPEIPLNFTVNEPLLEATYTLDGRDGVPVTGNTTLTNLADGSHLITIHALDEAGNIGSSETIYFTVAKAFPTAIVITAIALATVIGLGCLIYFKKSKH
jgi:hypothetical protein